jgi:D-alanine-D-alanine ligase
MNFNNDSDFFWKMAKGSLLDSVKSYPLLQPCRVLVLAGGPSSEHWVSLRSAENLLPALKSLGHDVEQVSPSLDLKVFQEQVLDSFQGKGPDIALNILHGYFGEDGQAQTILDLLKIPNTFCSPQTSMVAMNKIWSKKIAESLKISAPKGLDVSGEEYKERKFFYPHVVKPNNGGSSLGVWVINSWEEQLALSLDQNLAGNYFLVEQYFSGREFTVGIMDGLLLGITEIAYNGNLLQFNEKYLPDQCARHTTPPSLEKKLLDEILYISRTLYKAFQCNGIVRIDLRMDQLRGELHFLELNTQPGMTKTSFIPEMLDFMGVSMERAVNFLLTDGLRRFTKNQKNSPKSQGFPRGVREDKDKSSPDQEYKNVRNLA